MGTNNVLAEKEKTGIIIDKAGRRIEIQRPFKRIISLYGAHTENLFSLRLDREIIGVGRNETFPPSALKKPVFSYHDDPEKFIVAGPDLVLIRPMIDRGYPDLVQRLEKWGITVVSLQPVTAGEIYEYWNVLGLLTGRTKEALQMAGDFKKEVREIRAVTEKITRKQRVYFEAIHDRMKTFSPDAIAIFALESAGGVNVARDAESVRGTNIAYYGKERIISRAHEIDAFIAQKGTMNNPTISIIRNEPGFSIINAIKEGRILIIDEMIVSRPTMRLIQGIRKIAEFLYPGTLQGEGY